MNEEQKNRSPNSPKFDLNHAIDLIRTLHTKIGRSAVKAEIAAGALGYNGMNGAALGTLGAISQYGLIDRGSGNVQVTNLALSILHPIDDTKKNAALREAALNPKVFGEIYEKWNDMTEDVLSNHLIHQNFTPEGAKRAASIYKLNYSIANLGASSSPTPKDDIPQTPEVEKPKDNQGVLGFGALIQHTQPRNKMLATFKIPVGSAEAELIFTGDKLEAADFDALAEYITLFKKQYGRKLGLAGEQLTAFLKDGTMPKEPSPSSSTAQMDAMKS